MDVTESTAYEPEECACCKGMLKRLGEQCRVCKGKGALLVAQPERKCIPCRGSGHEGGFSDLPVCLICRGAGWRGVYEARS